MKPFVTGSKAWTNTFDEVAAKAKNVRVGLEERGIKLRAGSALWQLLRQADTLSLVWAEGGKPRNEVVWDTLHVNRLADVVTNLLDEPGIEMALTRMAGSVMQPDDRRVSQGKAAFWELVLLSFLKDRGFSVKAAEPDILVDFGFGDYPIACKKSWSEKGIEDHVRKAAKQLAPFRNGGVIALNLDDLVPSGHGLAVPTLEQASLKLSRAQQSFIEKHKGLLAKAVIEGIRHLQEASAQGHPAAVYNLAAFIEVGRVPGRTPDEAEAEYERAMEHREYRARSALYAAQIIEHRSEAMTDLLRAARHLQTCYSVIDTSGDPHSLRGECLSTCRKVVGRIRDHLNINGPNHSLKADDIFTSALFDKNCVPVIDMEARLRYLWGVISGFDPIAVTAHSEFLIREACLTPRPARSAAGWKGSITLHRAKGTTLPRPATISSAHDKVGRNDPCPCGSGDKYKKCHGS